jgi:hypothetical protein
MPLAQSVLALHVVAHRFVAGSQLNGAQIVAGPERHRPSPSQTLTSLTAAPSQVPGLQMVPAGYLRHWPRPSHVPSSPQVETADIVQAPDGSDAPLGTNEQIPGALWSLHVLHVSVQAVLQQTPSAQKPLWQSSPQPQGCPFVRRAPPSPDTQAASMPASPFDPPLSPPQPPPQPETARSSAQIR